MPALQRRIDTLERHAGQTFRDERVLHFHTVRPIVDEMILQLADELACVDEGEEPRLADHLRE
jgi:hypothetical protein